ncbi:hypothetical protein MN116_007509 [Schistosoma mekongi]|uniref:26S proteasome non-ATPase regulatory subunit 7 n=1 Tax=Schistosoma mekongi TaxID=38744 RepID=A0AAE2D3L3_SCHME|nr:hypothetical protein MN116_007509 [Schistosoma mekongi]
MIIWEACLPYLIANVAREKIVGWYHSGPELCTNDIKINELFRRYASNSVLLVVNVRRKEVDGLPTEAYIAGEEVHDDGSPTTKSFDHLRSEVDAEEVGVDHLLRDVKDTSLGSLSQRIGCQLDGLFGLLRQLYEIREYLQLVSSSKLPVNHGVIYHLQDIFNLPDLKLHDTVRAIHVNTNNQLLVICVAAIMRTILALHDLIGNKLTNRESERNEEGLGGNSESKSVFLDQSKRTALKSDNVDNGKTVDAGAKSNGIDFLKKED